MTPAEQNAARQNFEQFRSLPTEERQQVLQGLRRWRQLPPAERQHMLEKLSSLAANDARAAQGGAHPTGVSFTPSTRR